MGSFNTFLNTCDPDLQFTSTGASSEGVVSLDLKINTGINNHIETDIYCKACDPHAYLLPTSCHPTHICKNIPKSVLTRVKRNCSTEAAYHEGLKEYTNYLKLRDYSDAIIKTSIEHI